MKKKIVMFLSFLVLMTSVGVSAWKVDLQDEIRPNLTPSGLTDYIAGANNTSYIYDQGTSASSYKTIKTDPTYNSTLKTIHLGYSNTVLEITQDTHFTHADKQVAYTETEYNSTSFHTADGSAETATFYDENGNSQNYYYSSKANATNAKQSTISARSQWINYYYHDHTVNHYSSDGTYKKLTLPSGRLYTIKLVGDVVLKAGKSLSIGAFIGSTGSGFAGPMIEGNFVVLDLNGHALTIESGATLNAYGYIIDSSRDLQGKHKGKIVNYGTIYSGFVVENYSGGGNTVGTAAYGTAPFTIYSLPYLACKVYFKGDTSYLKAPTSLYASSMFSKTIINMIAPSSSSTNALIKKSSDAIVIRDNYNDPLSNSSSTLYAQNTDIYYEIDGDVDITTIKMELSLGVSSITIDKTINMAEFGFSIPSYAHINLKSGVVTLGMQIDFLPGSTLNIESAATLSLGQTTLSADDTIAGSSMIKYGGLKMLSLMSADSSYCYKGLTYGAGITAYSTYQKDILQKGNYLITEANANIYGNIKITSGTPTNHVIAGKINIHNANAMNVIKTASTFYKNVEIHAYLNFGNLSLIEKGILAASPTASNIKNYSEDPVYSSYIILPLVSNGLVINPEKIDTTTNLLGSDTKYDFAEGIYYSSGKTYSYITNDTAGNLSGNIREVTHDADNHQIIYNNKRYTFYRNIFVNNSDAVSDGIFALDNAYTGYSVGTYNKVDIANMTVDYTYKYTATGTTEIGDITSSSSRTRSRGLLSSWTSWSYSNPSTLTDSDWSARKNIVWDYNSITNITTSGEATTGTFYDSTYNIDRSVEIISMSFNSGKDTSNYKELSLLSTTYRPGNHGKFSQANTDYYYSIGNIQMQYHIEAGSSTTSWLVNVNSAEDYYTTDKWNKEVQVIKANVSRSNVTMEDQTWTLTRPMYLKGNKSCLYWNATTLMWCKRQ